MTQIEMSTVEMERVPSASRRPVGVRELFGAPFRVLPPWMVWAAWVWGFAMLALMIWCAVAFFGAETERGMIAWAAGFVAATVGGCWVDAWWWLTAYRGFDRR